MVLTTEIRVPLRLSVLTVFGVTNPPEDGWGTIKPQFYLGILLVAVGAVMVTYFKPPPAKHAPAPAAQVAPNAAPGN